MHRDSTSVGRRWPLVMTPLLVTALAVRLLAWWLFPNIHHADEVFQYQEQAFRLVDGYGIVPWEYLEGIRSWHLPGLLAGILWVAEALPGGGAGWWPVLMATAMGLLSLSVVCVAAVYGRWLGGLPGAVLAGGFTLVWYELVYFAPKTLTTMVGTHLMLLGLLAGGLGLRRVSHRRLVLAGALLAAGIVVRPQLGAGIAVVAGGIMWRHREGRSARWLLVGVGGALMVLGAVDLLAFDYPYQWLVENVRINVVEGMTSQFGTDPWYWYARIVLRVWLYLTPFLLALFLIGVRKLWLPAAAAVVFVVSHSLFAHKEYRFIYAAVVLGLLVCSAGAVQAVARLARSRAWSERRTWTVVAGIIALAGAAGVARSLDRPFVAHWQNFSSRIAAFETLHDDATLASIVVDLKWTSTPGYSGLQRDVPLHTLTASETLEGLAGSYTHLVTLRDPDRIPKGHEKLGEWHEDDETVYVFRYTGDAAVSPPMEINEQIRRQWDLFRTGVSDQVNP